MKFLKIFVLIGMSKLIFAETICETKMKKMILSSDQINFNPEIPIEISNFKFIQNGNSVEGKGVVLIYNGDTEYRLKGFILPYGSNRDCVITDMKVEIMDY